MGEKSSKTTQKNEPPEWSKPLFEKSAAEAMRLYDSGIGYNVYDGPTQAALSDQTLGGMNAMMAATGGGGAPITNESINKLIPSADIQKQIDAMKQRNAQQAQKPAQQASSGIPDWVMLGANSEDLATKLRATHWLQKNKPEMGYSTRDVMGGGGGGGQ
ncbi:hypothetical protein AB4144_03230 [Rhizobiaceae sp. 2RAB30]